MNMKFLAAKRTSDCTEEEGGEDNRKSLEHVDVEGLVDVESNGAKDSKLSRVLSVAQREERHIKREEGSVMMSRTTYLILAAKESQAAKNARIRQTAETKLKKILDRRRAVSDEESGAENEGSRKEAEVVSKGEEGMGKMKRL